MKKFFNTSVLLSIFIILFTLFQLFSQKGFFVTDDGDWMVIRFSAFHQVIRDGEFPVRFLSRLNNEYGYPVATFLYPGPFYLAEPLHVVGFSFVDSIKILFLLSFIISGVFIFLWLRKFFTLWPSLIGSLFYIYAPYHLYDYYKRGSLGEMVALAVIPFILWQIERESLFWSAVGLGFLIISHNTLALLFILFLVVYCALDIFIAKKRKKVSLFYLKILLFGFGLSTFFWIPALFELHYTVFSKTIVANWKEYFASLSLLGYPILLVSIITLVLFFTKRIVLKKHRLTFFMLIVTLVTLFFASSLSSLLWNILPFSVIQFPFRVLSITLIAAAFLSASCLSFFKGKSRIVLSVIFIVVLIFSTVSYAKPTGYTNRDEGFYTTNMDTTTVKNEYMPTWAKEISTNRPTNKIEVIKGDGEITNLVQKSNRMTFTAILKKPSTLQINTVYWPGWEIVINGKKQKLSYANPQGVMQVTLPSGTHNVTVQFSETPLRIIADSISLLTLLVLSWLSLNKRKK